MNLLSVLLKVMLADAAVSALSGKTGLSSGALKKLLPLAIPLLLRYMTSNASTQSGALSLLGALTQHSTARSMDEMFAEADEEDGGKIVKHILGDDSSRAVQTLAAESGLSADEVNRGLGALAPALLAMLAAATTSASHQSTAQSGTLDLTDLLTMFGGASAPASQQSIGSSLLGSLLGGASTQQQSSSMGLLDALLGVTPTQQQTTSQQSPGLLGSLLGITPTQPAQTAPQQSGGLLSSLFGAPAAQQQVAQQQSPSLLGSLLGVTPTQQTVQQSSVNNLNGNNLLSLLLGAMQ
ncbi:MAG: DUF937 domain-containing protein [Oscillospiraceae bacterium]|nr:DUF937 domain-containing protein [Oscillospiraceae bacterium]MBQ9250876.1 DUF937 domain-containing protein [Oscillospiraceae bacterium]